MTLIAYVYWQLQTAGDVVTELSKKSHLRRLFDQQRCKRSQDTVQTSTTAPLSYILITVKEIELEEVSLSLLGLFVNTLTDDDKYSLFNRDKLTQPIQIL